MNAVVTPDAEPVERGVRAIKKLMVVEYDDDADLSNSRKRPGQFSPLTRDAEKNLGHATLSEPDDSDLDELLDPWYVTSHSASSQSEAGEEDEGDLVDLAIAGLFLAGMFIAAEAGPRITRWLEERAATKGTTQAEPSRMRSKLAAMRQRGTKKPKATEKVVEAPTATRQASRDVASAVNEFTTSMSSSEARQRLAAALNALTFGHAQLQLLRNARIDDSADELEGDAASLPPELVIESIVNALEANPGLLDDPRLAELGRRLHAYGNDDAYAFIPAGDVREVLRITRT